MGFTLTREFGLSQISLVNRKAEYQAIIIGSLVLIILLVIVDVSGHLSAGFSRWYTSQSLAPFHSSSPLSRRFLIPLLGSVTGLSGEAFPVIIRLATLLFLILLSRYFLASLDFGRAFLATAIVGLLPVTEFCLVVGTWPDIAVYMFFLLALLNYRFSLFWSVMGVWSHEMYLFLIPMVPVLNSLELGTSEKPEVAFKLSPKDILVKILLYALIGVLALCVRGFITESNSVEFGPFQYVKNFWNAGGGLAFRQNLSLSIFFTFKGLILLFSIWVFVVCRKSATVSLLWLCILQFVLVFVALEMAHDTTRVLCLSFPLMILILRSGIFSSNLLRLILAIHILVPSYYIGIDWYARLRVLDSPIDQFVEKYWKTTSK